MALGTLAQPTLNCLVSLSNVVGADRDVIVCTMVQEDPGLHFVEETASYKRAECYSRLKEGVVALAILSLCHSSDLTGYSCIYIAPILHGSDRVGLSLSA